MSSYRRYYLPRVSWSDVKGGVWRIQPYNVTDYFFIFRVQNLLTSASACFLEASGWGVFSRLDIFAPTRLHLLSFRLGHFFLFGYFCPNSLASSLLPVGEFLPVWTFLPQSACIFLASGWGFSSCLGTFSPTRLLPLSFRLEYFFHFGHFPPIREVVN